MIPPGMEGMAEQMMRNPQMRQQFQQMMAGGGFPGMPGGAAQQAPAEPKLGEVY